MIPMDSTWLLRTSPCRLFTGDKLAREMIKIRPDIPVILCSGYSEKISDEKIKEIGIRTVLLKPIVSKDMSRIVKAGVG